MKRKVELYDTTLRDGAQMKGISFSVADKVKIVRKLDEFGIDYIEGGWPGSNPKDIEFFKAVSSLALKRAVITAFSMTCRKGVEPENDPNMRMLLESGAQVITLVGKTWMLHVDQVLNADPEENLRLIKKSCRFFTVHGLRVFYDAEHFFEGFKDNPKYALQTLRAAVNGGAERIILCDTNGGALPWEVGKIVREVGSAIDVPLGIHTHNDENLAVANTIEAVRRGALQVQGTINGYGERCGNADLCSVVPILQLRMGVRCVAPEKLTQLTEISYFVSEIANLTRNPFQPFVGANAFVHKGGMHGDATVKCEESYQHINPSLVGREPEIVVSELSGKSNILAKAKEFGIELSVEEAKKVLLQIKNLENQGFQFEGAEASVELLMRRIQKGYEAPFDVLYFTVLVDRHKGQNLNPRAIIKFLVKGREIHTAAEGDGPVNALDLAARKALLSVYPALGKVQLRDYKVRILDEKAGTGAKVRVLIDFSADGSIWTTVGSSTDIIQASWQAISDGLEYAILNHIS